MLHGSDRGTANAGERGGSVMRDGQVRPIRWVSKPSRKLFEVVDVESLAFAQPREKRATTDNDRRHAGERLAPMLRDRGFVSVGHCSQCGLIGVVHDALVRQA